MVTSTSLNKKWLGCMIIVIGVLCIFIIPFAIPYESKSEVVADNERYSISPRFETKNFSYSASVHSLWKNGNTNTGEIVMNVPLNQTCIVYSYPLIPKYSDSDEAKNISIVGQAKEIHTPQRNFNFYIFDYQNLVLWSQGSSSYNAYYVEKGKTDMSFSFCIKDTLTITDCTFYFVVEEYVIGIKPDVHLNASLSWLEEYTLSYIKSKNVEFFSFPSLIRLYGNVKSLENEKFDITVSNGIGSTTYYQATDVSSYSFSLELFNVDGGLIIVSIQNWGDKDITIKFEGNEMLCSNSTGIISNSFYPSSLLKLSDIPQGKYILPSNHDIRDVKVKGSIREDSGKKFTLSVYNIPDDSEDSYSLYEKNVAENTTQTFDISIPIYHSQGEYVYVPDVKFIFKNPSEKENIIVTLSATFYWQLKPWANAWIIGFVIGISLIVIGIIFLSKWRKEKKEIKLTPQSTTQTISNKK